MNAQVIDISSELLVLPYANGIKLIKPEQHPANSNLLSVSQVFNFPFSIYFSNRESEIQNLNESGLLKCGFNSYEDAIGKSIRDLAKAETVNYVLDHERAVMQNKMMVVKEVHFKPLTDDEEILDLSIKFPWYNENNQIIGNFGCVILFKAENLASSISILTNAGLLARPQPNIAAPMPAILPGTSFGEYYFTKREKDVLNNLILGKTAKGIAKQLQLSPRTIENYLSDLKAKVDVTTKAALIEKVVTIMQQ